MLVPYLPADTIRSVSSTSKYGDRAGGRVSLRPHSRTSRKAGEIQFRARVNTFKTEVVVRSENEELVEYCSLLYLVGLPQLPACAAGSQCDSRVSDLLQRLVFRTSF